LPNTVTVTCLAKLEKIPVFADPDYTLLQNIEAITEEAQAVRYDGMDLPNKSILVGQHHTSAIRLLNGELTHYLGLNEPAINFAPFGSARLYRKRIGTLI
jgi:hypothetical protein